MGSMWRLTIHSDVLRSAEEHEREPPPGKSPNSTVCLARLLHHAIDVRP